MLEESPLGQPTKYIETYTPGLLYPIPRTLARNKTGIPSPQPFDGVDIWNAYEISWLTPSGKPEIALAEFRIPCSSPCIVESKSLKLYLNSLNQTYFPSFEDVQATIHNDLSQATQANVTIKLYGHSKFRGESLNDLPGICLDGLDVETPTYLVDSSFLITSSDVVDEELYSNLLKSNCLATGQPDWGSLYIHYKGQKIAHDGLLKYIISYRNHSGFAEHCVEQIFCDIQNHCKPTQLTVYARYTRRGGLDINPFRSNFELSPTNIRQPRQ
jgi:7-cyano-7-deazaguanine reductase